MEPIPETTEAVEEFGPFDDADLLQDLRARAGEVQAFVPDCVGLSLSSSEHDVTWTMVATSEEIAVLDAVQYLDDGPCVHAVEVAVAPAMRLVVTQAVDDVAPPCTQVETTVRSGGDVALAVSTGAELPDVWISDGGMWMTPTYLGAAAGLRVMSPALARTPVILVGGPLARRFPSWGAAEASGGGGTTVSS